MDMKYQLKTLRYKVPHLAEWLHSFPHYDFAFEKVSPAFNPSNESYVQSLLVAGGALVLFLALWIIIFALYFLCSCIHARRRTGLEKTVYNGRCLRWATVVSVLLLLTSLIVAFYGNEKAHIGAEKAAQSLSEFSDDRDNLYVQTFRLAALVEDNSTYSRELNKLGGSGADIASLESYRQEVFDVVNNTIPEMVHPFTHSAAGEDELLRNSLLSDPRLNEHYRWISTLAACLWQVLCCMLVWCGIGMKSRGMLLLCLALSLINLICLWGAAGVYTAGSVGAGDFCVDPNESLKSEMSLILRNGTISPDKLAVLDYYLRCSADEKSVYFFALNKLQNALIASNNSLQQLRTQHPSKVDEAQGSLNNLFTGFLKLVALADCTAAHKSYVEAISNVCHNSLLGMVYLAFAFISAGLFMILSIFLIHLAAKSANMRSFRHNDYDVDSQEPFIPRSQQSAPLTDNQLYYRFSQISTAEGDNPQQPGHSSSRDNPQAPKRNTPPPAYHTTHSSHGTPANREFYSTYGNSETLDSRPGLMESRGLSGSPSYNSGTIESARP